MPQMMPINWIFLFIEFLIIFMLFNMMNYYLYTMTPKNLKFKNLIHKKYWSW